MCASIVCVCAEKMPLGRYHKGTSREPYCLQLMQRKLQQTQRLLGTVFARRRTLNDASPITHYISMIQAQRCSVHEIKESADTRALEGAYHPLSHHTVPPKTRCTAPDA
jgi:hypothetical protein